MPSSRAARLAAPALLSLALLPAPAAAVVGGVDASPGAAVMVLSSNGGVCTGIALAPDVVLTAAHCAGTGLEQRVHYRNEAGEPVLVTLAARAVHPGYDAGAVAGRRPSVDLALLRTATPLPARFAPATLGSAQPRAGETLDLAGYGAARPGDPRSTGTFRRAALSVVEPHGPSRILVWLKAPGAGGCNGDSGGPILAGETVVAVAAWVKDACGGLTQGILLGPQRGWIDRTLAGWGVSARW